MAPFLICLRNVTICLWHRAPCSQQKSPWQSLGCRDCWEQASPRIQCPAARSVSDALSYLLRKHLLSSMLPECFYMGRKVGEPIILFPYTHLSTHYDHVFTLVVSVHFNKEPLSAPICLHFIHQIPCPKLCQEMIFLWTGSPVEKMNTVLFQSPRLCKAAVTFPTASSIRETIPA